MRLLYLTLLLFFWFTSSSVSAQVGDTAQSTAYDLLSSYYNTDFRPFKKNNFYVGLSFTVENVNLDNTQRILTRVNEGRESDFSIQLSGGYFFSSYVMAEFGIRYSRDEFEGSVFNQDGDSLFRRHVSNKAVYSPGIRVYFPLTENERLSFFNSVNLGVGYGQSLSRDQFSEDRIDKRYAEEFEFSIGISPGINFFAIENFAFEVQLQNLIGYEFNSVKTTVNNIDESSQQTHNVNFNINLLSLQLGLAYYFGAKK